MKVTDLLLTRIQQVAGDHLGRLLFFKGLAGSVHVTRKDSFTVVLTVIVQGRPFSRELTAKRLRKLEAFTERFDGIVSDVWDEIAEFYG